MAQAEVVAQQADLWVIRVVEKKRIVMTEQIITHSFRLVDDF